MRRFRPSRRAVAIVAAAAVAGAATAALASTGHRILQKGRAFNVKEIAIAVGDVVHFVNDDAFIHQIFVKARNFQFDSAESDPGHVIDLKFTEAGTFDVRCHIHPKMLLKVTAK